MSKIKKIRELLISGALGALETLPQQPKFKRLPQLESMDMFTYYDIIKKRK